MKKILYSFLAVSMILSAPVANAVTISPTDKEAQEILSKMGFEITPSDPLWRDAEFQDYVSELKQAKQDADELIDEVIEFIDSKKIDNLALLQIRLAKIGSQIDDERFQKIYGFSNDEINKLNDAEKEIKTMLSQMRIEVKKARSEMDIIEIFQELDPSGMKSMLEQPALAMAKIDGPFPLEPGKLVMLKNLTPDLSANTQSIWTQVEGPKVVWVKTENPHDAAFITPRVNEQSDQYVTFKLTVVNEDGSLAATQVSSKIQTPQVAVLSLYAKVLKRNPDQNGLIYWTEQYKKGMTLEQMEYHFKQSKEYKNLNK